MHLMFLGTGAMVPTKQRNVSSTLLEFDGEFILFDCGEGTQRQMNLAGYNRVKVKKVLITHWHGDHVAGLIGLIQTIGNVPNPGTLKIIGPRGTKQHMHHLMHSALFDARLHLDIVEVDPQGVELVHEQKKYEIYAAPVQHAVPTIAFSFVERSYLRIDMEKLSEFGLKTGPLLSKLQKGEDVEHNGNTIPADKVTYQQVGRKVAYVMDTVMCDQAIHIAKDSDIVICESTFLATEHQNKADEYDHLSARDAATIADKADAKQLVLTHFSQRYLSSDSHVEEAKSVFQNTIAAYDFLRVDVNRT